MALGNVLIEYRLDSYVVNCARNLSFEFLCVYKSCAIDKNRSCFLFETRSRCHGISKFACIEICLPFFFFPNNNGQTRCFSATIGPKLVKLPTIDGALSAIP